MKAFKSSNFLALLGFASLGAVLPACGTRNLYRHALLQNPPLQRGLTYVSRQGILEAGKDPVEFGSPLATKDLVFVESETIGMEAFERLSFRRRWAFPIKNGASSTPLQEGNAIYFGANDGNFYAVGADFGQLLWKYESKAPVYARATSAGKRLFISSSDDVLYCLDKETGKWIWHYKRGGHYITTIHGNSAPAVDGDLVYAGFSDGYIVALKASDGNLAWEQKIHKGTKFTDVDAMPLVDGDIIYIPSYDGELYALEKTKGRIIWHIDIGGSKKALLEDRTLYLASSNGHVYALDKQSGRISWNFELDEGTPTNLAQHGDYLAFGSSRQYFYAIQKKDGALAYRFSAGLRSGFFSTPSSFDQSLYILSNFGNLYVFNWKLAQDNAIRR